MHAFRKQCSQFRRFGSSAAGRAWFGSHNVEIDCTFTELHADCPKLVGKRCNIHNSKWSYAAMTPIYSRCWWRRCTMMQCFLFSQCIVTMLHGTHSAQQVQLQGHVPVLSDALASSQTMHDQRRPSRSLHCREWVNRRPRPPITQYTIHRLVRCASEVFIPELRSGILANVYFATSK